MVGFAVDTHLLRELGDLLVGRDSTAVLELIKNSYDADARHVTLRGTNLNDPGRAEIVVSDDGNGMSEARFSTAFLRIAGRDKESGARVSARYERAYTGQKGIGRLASQKLARRLDVESYPRGGGDGVRALIDWQAIDKQDTLDNLEEGLKVEAVPSHGAPRGTVMRLRSLKRAWTPEEAAQFVAEVAQTQPPQVLLRQPALFVREEPARFDHPHLRDAATSDPGFDVHLEGDFAAGDDPWEVAAREFDWCVEVDVAHGTASYSIVPSQEAATKTKFARAHAFQGSADPALRFQARFFVLENASTRRGPLKEFTRTRSGVRVYLEGFRVLPYGERGDDWLELDSEYRSGARYYSLDVESLGEEDVENDNKEALSALQNTGYYGAVFLTSAGAADLQSVINREGFVPSPMFNEIKTIVQTAVRLSVRVRRSVLLQTRLEGLALPTGMRTTSAGHDGEHSVESPAIESSAKEHIRSNHAAPSSGSHAPSPEAGFPLLAPHRITAASRAAIDRAAARVASARTLDEIADAATDLRDGFVAARETLDALSAVQPELRVLAGVGLQLGAFVHDINGMLGSTRVVRRLLDKLLETEPDSRRRREMRAVLTTAEELAHVLARQSSYLTDVLSLDPRRRRSRVRVTDSLQSVFHFLETRIEAKKIRVHTDVAADLKSPPMFPAELSVLLTNLLTNAVKNAADEGHIWVSGFALDERGIELSISNDGNAVELVESERWFQPFESTTVEVDEVLGQGLGLGLPIVRSIVTDYNGAAWFSEPVDLARTTVRVQIRERG